MSYPLKVVLWVRKLSEDKALHLLNVARAEEKRAREEVTTREKELADYVAWCFAEEERLYKAILGKPVSHKTILFTREQISWNSSQQVKYERKVDEARADLRLKEGAVAQALEHYQKMSREVFKLEQHRSEWMLQAARIEENIQENEIEEAGEMIHNFRQSNA